MLLETEFKFNIKSLILHRNKLFVVRIDIICIVIRKIGTIFWYPLWWGNWVTTISVQFWWWKMFCPSFLVSFLWRSFLKIILDLLALAEVNIQTYSSILSFSWLLCLISCMRYQQIFVAAPEKLPLFRRKVLKEEEEPWSSLLTWFGWELIIRQTAILRSKRTILIAMRRMMNNRHWLFILKERLTDFIRTKSGKVFRHNFSWKLFSDHAGDTIIDGATTI